MRSVTSWFAQCISMCVLGRKSPTCRQWVMCPQNKCFMKISLLSSFKGIDKCLYIVCMHACLHCMPVNDLRECVFQWFTGALYEKEQSIVAYDAEFSKLRAQLEEWKSIAKGSQGKVII